MSFARPGVGLWNRKNGGGAPSVHRPSLWSGCWEPKETETTRRLRGSKTPIVSPFWLHWKSTRRLVPGRDASGWPSAQTSRKPPADMVIPAGMTDRSGVPKRSVNEYPERSSSVAPALWSSNQSSVSPVIGWIGGIEIRAAMAGEGEVAADDGRGPVHPGD